MRITRALSITILVAVSPPLARGAPSPCPSDASVIGYSDWITLKHDIEKGSGGTYTLCPQTKFDATSQHPDADFKHISLESSVAVNGIAIQCGKFGNVENNCVIKGGQYHFKVGGGGWDNDVTMNGLTFRESYFCSIHVGYLFNKKLTFNDCLWTNNVDKRQRRMGLFESLESRKRHSYF